MINIYKFHPMELCPYLIHPIDIKGLKDKVNDELIAYEIIWFNS